MGSKPITITQALAEDLDDIFKRLRRNKVMKALGLDEQVRSMVYASLKLLPRQCQCDGSAPHVCKWCWARKKRRKK